MVYSPLHCLCAELIVSHFERDAKNFLFYLKPGFGELVNPSLWNKISYLPWPRFYPMPGFLGRIRQTQQNLHAVAENCHGAQRIVLHTSVIDTEAVNYNINFLKKKFPQAEFKIRLFPDGLLNLKRHPLGLFKELLQYSRLLRRVICPDLHYYRFTGDRIGSDDAIVEKIYTFPRFPHQYSSAKVTCMPEFEKSDKISNRLPVLKSALVIGQPLIAYGRMSEQTVKVVTKGIYDYLLSCGVEQIFYKSHHRDNRKEFAMDEYQELIIKKPLEHHLKERPYDIVIGVCSTSLLTGKMILPSWCKVVSYGMDLMQFNNNKEKECLISIFNKLEVELISSSNHYQSQISINRDNEIT